MRVDNKAEIEPSEKENEYQLKAKHQGGEQWPWLLQQQFHTHVQLLLASSTAISPFHHLPSLLFLHLKFVSHYPLYLVQRVARQVQESLRGVNNGVIHHVRVGDHEVLLPLL